jgi:hypothetical protein
VVQAELSSHAVPTGSGARRQTPVGLQMSGPVHEFRSSQAVPSGSALPRHTPEVQKSPVVQELPSSQTTLERGRLQQPLWLHALNDVGLHESCVQEFPSSQLTAS